MMMSSHSKPGKLLRIIWIKLMMIKLSTSIILYSIKFNFKIEKNEGLFKERENINKLKQCEAKYKNYK